MLPRCAPWKVGHAPWLEALRSCGRLLAVYVAQGNDLVPLPLPGIRRPRGLGGSTALVRTLRDLTGPVLGPGEPTPLSEAVLQELRAEAALLIRSHGQLVAVASVACDPGAAERLALALPDIEERARRSWPGRAQRGAAALGPGGADSWLRRIGARLFGPDRA